MALNLFHVSDMKMNKIQTAIKGACMCQEVQQTYIQVAPRG
jgi:hypothetical protein